MKRIILLLLFFMLAAGCSEKDEKSEENNKNENDDSCEQSETCDTHDKDERCEQLGICDETECNENAADMVQINSPNGSFRIDTYEASRANATKETTGMGVTLACNYQGTVPWSNITYEEARDACQDAGKRLCTKDEWMAACGTQDYPYGSEYASNTCTDSDWFETALTGSKSNCKSSTGVFDMSGNAREWVEGGILMGGAFNSGKDEVKCTSMIIVDNYLSYIPNHGDGFRCCDDKVK